MLKVHVFEIYYFKQMEVKYINLRTCPGNYWQHQNTLMNVKMAVFWGVASCSV
jgi:hypothetical protein